jgi:hypothetical protein
MASLLFFPSLHRLPISIFICFSVPPFTIRITIYFYADIHMASILFTLSLQLW